MPDGLGGRHPIANESGGAVDRTGRRLRRLHTERVKRLKKPVLVVMAAGMGSRYGGLKQIDPVGRHGEVIVDYSIYDALRAGFEQVVFVIKKEIEEDFYEVIGRRMEKRADVSYAFQRLDDLPAGYAVPEGRVKPWGTAQAIYSIRGLVDAPFAVINADDYYGPHAFQLIYDHLCRLPEEGDILPFCMVGYRLKNTLTEYGHVARGVCSVDEDGFLREVVEHTHIEKTAAGARFTEDGGQTWTDLDPETVVSMNLWGFTPGLLDEIGRRFPAFLDQALVANPLKGEYLLPSVVNELLQEGKAAVKVLTSPDKWCGVTYKEDKPAVMQAIEEKHRAGLYPEPLWE